MGYKYLGEFSQQEQTWVTAPRSTHRHCQYTKSPPCTPSNHLPCKYNFYPDFYYYRLVLSISEHLAVVHYFSLLYSFPLYECYYLIVYLIVDGICVVSSFGLLIIALLWTFLNIFWYPYIGYIPRGTNAGS